MTARITLIGLCALLGGAAAAPASAALSWDQVKTAYAAVHDYTCLYGKEEQAIDTGDLQRIKLYFRKPLDVKMEWLDDKGKVNQVAVYREGMNDGKVLAKRTGGVASWFGTLKLDPHGGRAMEDSRHPIMEVGLGHIVETVAHEIESGAATAAPAVDDTLDGRPVSRFDFESKSGSALFGVHGAVRAQIWVDNDLQLPVKVELRDSSGGLVERHRFTDIKLNVGLTDQVFTL